MTYEFTVYCPLLLANAQRRMHYHVWGKITAEARQKSAERATEYAIPHVARACIAIYPGQGPTKNGRKPRLADAGNHYPIAKAVIDGLIDAGVLEDDGPEQVLSVTMHAPVRTERHQVRVVISDP